MPARDDAIGPVAMSPDEKWIAAGAQDDIVLMWKREGEPIRLAARHEAEVRMLVFSPNGHRLASASEDGLVLVTDTRTGEYVGHVALVADTASFLWFSPDSGTLLIDTERHFEIAVALAR